MAYRFGKRSENNLKGVHPVLVQCARDALAVSKVDFGVSSGLRTFEEQYALYNQKPRKSWLNGIPRMMGKMVDGVKIKGTGVSKHQEQADGYSHAIDIFVFKNGKVSWARESFVPAINAFRKAALSNGVIIITGSSWQYLQGMKDEAGIKQAVKEYAKKSKARGRRPWHDYPHLEIEF